MLILRDVLGFSAREMADALETSVTAVYSALQRARKTIDEQLPERGQQATLRALGDERVRAARERYVDAWDAGDVDAVVALLAEDAELAMPPRPSWFRGRRGGAGFLARGPLAAGKRQRSRRTHANGQAAFGYQPCERRAERFEAHVLQVLTLRGGRIAESPRSSERRLVARFGLSRTAAMDRGAGWTRQVNTTLKEIHAAPSEHTTGKRGWVLAPHSAWRR